MPFRVVLRVDVGIRSRVFCVRPSYSRTPVLPSFPARPELGLATYVDVIITLHY
jgi:hypothetical protein